MILHKFSKMLILAIGFFCLLVLPPASAGALSEEEMKAIGHYSKKQEFDKLSRLVNALIVKYPADKELAAIKKDMIETGVWMEAESSIAGKLTNSVGMKMTLVPGDNYYIAATETTRYQWFAVMENQHEGFDGDTLPMTRVDWDSCLKFCRKLTELEKEAGRLPKGFVYSLPTEAQWEKACRAGTTGNFAGSLDAMAWYNANSGGKPHPVATKQANRWGFYDMHGNVSEWCNDRDQSKFADATHRGGSWSDDGESCRSDKRGSYGTASSGSALGFRAALLSESLLSISHKDSSEPIESVARGIDATEKIQNSIGLEMIKVPGNNFYLATTETTQIQWKSVMENDPSITKGVDLPVENLTWASCKVFCQRLTEIERNAGSLPLGFIYSLPTEDQWEKASRAGTTGDYALLDAVAWQPENSERKPHSVATKQGNSWGFYDMHGNVAEWCENSISDLDWEGILKDRNQTNSGLTTRTSDVLGASGPGLAELAASLEADENAEKEYLDRLSQEEKVELEKVNNDVLVRNIAVRGGSFNRFCRPSDRDRRPPGYHAEDLGFRPALVPTK